MSKRQVWDCIRGFLIEVAESVAKNWRAFKLNLNGVTSYLRREGRSLRLVFEREGGGMITFALGRAVPHEDGGHYLKNYRGLSVKIHRSLKDSESLRPALDAIANGYVPLAA